MTQTQHTPGPWSVYEGQAFDLERQIVISDETATKVLAAIDHDTDEDEANARLMAAAPQLLEACEEGLAFVAGADPLDRHAWEQMAATFRAAIAKA
jgi:hypothetical protein